MVGTLSLRPRRKPPRSRPPSNVTNERRFILARSIKKQLHLSEQLHPILLHHDKMCCLADLDEPLVRAAREFVEDSLRALAGGHPIPLSGDDQGWNLDPPGIVVWLACLPVIPNVMKNTGRTS